MAGKTDPINFWRAEHVFSDIDSWERPQEVEEIITDPPADIADRKHWHGITLKFVGGKLCSLQYIRPTVWRIRFDPTNKTNNPKMTPIEQRPRIVPFLHSNSDT
ncbi:uncharacterized protein H6S33_002389, partial [Morchella sextelata]|uniref:uncharacterized protein n=1 Tax=Morchella sextelata TaxID=1174677 RepID=UPI001D03DABD